MSRIGSEEVKAKAVVANAIAQPSRAKLVKGTNGGYVEVDESFDRAWRRVGLALDRVGFTVEDRDRTQGLYFVRYVDPDADQKQNDKGFFSKLFTFGSSSDKAKTAPRYRVSVKGAGTSSQVAVLNNEGRPETSQTADRILSLLNEQLK
jgi:outer membrane protein assembly factor BamC